MCSSHNLANITGNPVRTHSTERVRHPAIASRLIFSRGDLRMSTQRTNLLRQFTEEQHRLETAQNAVVTQQYADDSDMASCYETTQTNILFMRYAQRRLQSLAQKLRSVEDQSHLLCLDCEEEISPKRRAAVPGTMRCATCQEEWEETPRYSCVQEDVAEFPPMMQSGQYEYGATPRLLETHVEAI